MKIAVNRCYGGFGLSHDAMMRYAEIKGIKLYPFIDKRPFTGNITYETYMGQAGVLTIHYATEPLQKGKYSENSYFLDADIDRNDPVLIQVVEEMGTAANGRHAALEIVEIPEDVKWEIEEYDGVEHVAETHRTW